MILHPEEINAEKSRQSTGRWGYTKRASGSLTRGPGNFHLLVPGACVCSCGHAGTQFLGTGQREEGGTGTLLMCWCPNFQKGVKRYTLKTTQCYKTHAAAPSETTLVFTLETCVGDTPKCIFLMTNANVEEPALCLLRANTNFKPSVSQLPTLWDRNKNLCHRFPKRIKVNNICKEPSMEPITEKGPSKWYHVGS